MSEFTARGCGYEKGAGKFNIEAIKLNPKAKGTQYIRAVGICKIISREAQLCAEFSNGVPVSLDCVEKCPFRVPLVPVANLYD